MDHYGSEACCPGGQKWKYCISKTQHFQMCYAYKTQLVGFRHLWTHYFTNGTLQPWRK